MGIAVEPPMSLEMSPFPLSAPLPVSADDRAATPPEPGLAALVPDIPLATWVYDPATLRVLAVNDAAVRAYGYSRAEFLCLTVDRLRAEPERAALRAHLDRNGEREARLRVRHITREGGALQVEVIAEPVRVGGRSARRVIALDVTAAVEMEERHERLAQAVEQATDAIVITDAEGEITYVNPAFEAVTGYAKAEVMGANPRILKSDQQDAAFYERMWCTLRRGEVWRGRLVNRRKNGTLFEEEATIFPVKDAHGIVRSYVAAKRDVGRERHLEEQVRQAAKMEAVGRLAGGIAHDFNNLLNVITGYAELGLKRMPAQSDARRHIAEILRAADRAAGLTRQLLTFSRRQVVPPRVVDLNAVVRDMDGLLRRIIGEDVRLQCEPGGTPLQVLVDPGQMEQVVMNLAVNARDAMPDGGTLVVETASVEVGPHECGDLSPGRYAALTVTDTGCGMDAQTISRIFEPFFTTKAEGKGTGLGLSTVWGIVKQSGGRVTVKSEVGAGTQFRVLLPQIPLDSDAPLGQPHDVATGGPARPSESEAAAVVGARPGGTVLVVDDQDHLRSIVRDVLEAAGYRVLEAANGAEALTAAAGAGADVDLVLTDLTMPGMDGWQLVERLRSTRPGLPALIMSGLAERDEAASTSQAYLAKPFTAEALQEAVRRTLADYSREG
jgi:two-component system, cell cycle sensor histidine kinase and response regulator CckA